MSEVMTKTLAKSKWIILNGRFFNHICKAKCFQLIFKLILYLFAVLNVRLFCTYLLVTIKLSEHCVLHYFASFWKSLTVIAAIIQTWRLNHMGKS